LCRVQYTLLYMIYEFYGRECPHCQRMLKVSAKVMKDTGKTIERKEVWHNDANMKLLTDYDAKNECGGIPFYYNDETKKWLCGEVEYEELVELVK